jgi:hypothetical protein
VPSCPKSKPYFSLAKRDRVNAQIAPIVRHSGIPFVQLHSSPQSIEATSVRNIADCGAFQNNCLAVVIGHIHLPPISNNGLWTLSLSFQGLCAKNSSFLCLYFILQGKSLNKSFLKEPMV